LPLSVANDYRRANGSGKVAEKTNKLSVCLIKSQFTAFDQIVQPGTKSFEIDDVGTFYVEESHPRTPDWVKDFFGNVLDGKFHLLTASSKGLLLTKLEFENTTHIFAVLFGHGRHLLKDGVVEERFGLKVVLNAVIPNSLRSIDKTTLGSVPKQSREQISRAGVAANFGIDIEQDLLGSVTGTSKDARLGKTITGRDALSVSVKVDITELHDFLLACLERYQAVDYKVDFDWIDQIKDVRDHQTVDQLNDILIARLNAKTLDKIWMAAPDILDWVDVKGFRYAKRKRAEIEPDLDVTTFLATLKEENVTMDALENTMVFVISAKTDDVSAHWKAYRCLYAELEHDGKIFILHNGKWYEVAKGFTDEVLKSFDDTPESAIALPDYAHADEGAYNLALPALVANSHCMDCDLIMHGGGHSSIEFCDLLTAEKCFVHVKRYSGSQQLSHLFSQGVASAELFASDAAFREKLNEKLPVPFKLADVAARPDPTEYEVVFAIISKSLKPLDIPFFSKVSLRNARKRLEGYGYRVTKKKVANVGLVAA
jgi:uncharacterized protein (TIGR04141 family)